MPSFRNFFHQPRISLSPQLTKSSAARSVQHLPLLLHHNSCKSVPPHLTHTTCQWCMCASHLSTSLTSSSVFYNHHINTSHLTCKTYPLIPLLTYVYVLHFLSFILYIQTSPNHHQILFYSASNLHSLAHNLLHYPALCCLITNDILCISMQHMCAYYV